MIQVDNPVCDKSIICISHRDDDFLCVRRDRRIIIQDICKLAQDNACEFLLQKFVSRDLKIFINGKIHIVPRFWVRRADNIRDLAQVIYIKGLFPFLTFKNTVKGLLKT